MKILKRNILIVVFSLLLLLNGCFLLPPSNADNNNQQNDISAFDFIADEKMTLNNLDGTEYFNLQLYAGENYQVKTTVDSELGEDYYFKYYVKEDVGGKFTLSESGAIITNASATQNDSFVIDVDLYKVGETKRVAHKYFIFSFLVGDYANLVITNDNVTFNANLNTYYLTIESGNNFTLTYNVYNNVAYVLNFSLSNASDSSFITIDDVGNISTYSQSEDKVGKITITLTGENGTLYTAFIQVTVKKSQNFNNELKVYNRKTASEVNDGDLITIYQNSTVSFDIKYNNVHKTNAISVENTAILSVNNALNELTALQLGESEVTFTYEDISITITVTVIEDKVVSIKAPNGASDFIIVNNKLHYLNNLTVTYESGLVKEVTNLTLITTDITDNTSTQKNVTFTYALNGNEATITYPVKFYDTVEYNGITTSYDNGDYFENYYYGCVQPLPSEGNVKLLVIPVWFTDSTDFFTTAQKSQIVQDIEYSLNGNRPNTEFKSLKQYYEAQSYGAITMDITVSDFYNSTTSYEDYTDYETSKINNTYYLANNAINWYFETVQTESFSDYDLNNDGYLDGLILYYGANYYGAVGDTNKTTAYQLETAYGSEHKFNSLTFCSIGGLYGLYKQDPSNQLAVNDLSSTYSYAFKSSARTIIHEVGHMFGNVDLYEDQFASERYSPAGSFVMQDRNFGSHDPYHVNRIGWSKPDIYASNDYNLGDKITVNLTDFQSSGQNIILTNVWNENNSLYDEYLIIELFAPVGLNEFDAKVSFNNKIPSGIRVWHVNSTLSNHTSGGGLTTQISNGNAYKLAYSNNDVDSKYDVLHLIRNDENEPYNTNSALQTGGCLFFDGDVFSMEKYKSQFVNEGLLDNGEKLGWAFTVEQIFEKTNGEYSAVLTLTRTDNVRTEFTTSASLNRTDLSTPTGLEEYGEEIFGEDTKFSLKYNYVTPPSVYNQNYPISNNGMCLFASQDGNGGYIDLTINEISGKTVKINSITVTYFKLTNANPTVIVGGNEVTGVSFTPENTELYGFTYEVNASTVRIQNRYNETINHWSVLPLCEITINYSII